MKKQHAKTTVASKLLAFVLMFGLFVGSFAPAIAQDAPEMPSTDAGESTDTDTDTDTNTDTPPPPPSDDEGTTPNDEGTTPPDEGDQGTDGGDQGTSSPAPQASTVNDDEPEIPSDAEPISAEDLELLNSGGEETAFFFGDPTLRVEKNLIKDNIGNTDTPENFSFKVTEYRRFLLIFWVPNGTVYDGAFDADGVSEFEVDKGKRYVVTEYENSNYTTTYNPDDGEECDITFPLLGAPTYTCTITNDDIPPPPPVVPECNLGDSTTFDPFTLGSVNGQGGWGVTGGYDQEVVENTYGFPTFGCKSLRLSNAVTSGSFGDQTFSYSIANEAGETGAINSGFSGGTRTNHFEASFDVASALPTLQEGLMLTVSPDRGDGARMSYLRFQDQADGIHVYFYDYQEGAFVETDIATISRTPHRIKFSMTFIDGEGNDIVEIYIDNVLEHTGTSWEDYFRDHQPAIAPPTVDSLLFRASGTAVPGHDENGLLFDNFSLSSSNVEVPMCMLVSDDVNTYVGTLPAVQVTPHPVWSTAYSADGAEWIWEAGDADGTVTFTRTFTAANAGTATINIGADNSYTAKVNGNALSCDGTGENNFNSVNGPSGGPDTCTAPVVSGENTLEITVVNAGGAANPGAGNPAGLYYKVSIPNNSCTDVPPVQTSDVMLCKVSDAEGYPRLPNWQLYLKGENVQNDLSVPTNTSTGIDSVGLTAGVQYLVTAMGTWTNQSGANVVDAEYSTTDGWATHMDGYTGYQTDILELQINSAFDPNSDWGPYNSSHTYSRLFTPGVAGPANFRVFDGSGTTQNEGWFSDNAGSLLVDIDEALGGTTGETGCVTIEDVPYGAYTIGEIAQEEWSLVEIWDGESVVEGSVVNVNDSTETFTLVNHDSHQSCTIDSGVTTYEGGEESVLATFFHSSWTAVIEGASWIWGDAAIVDPVGTETQVFTKTFDLESVPVTGATLEIAADNSYEVFLNGNLVGGDSGEVNYTAAGQDVITISADDLEIGENTLEITVTNFPMGGGTQSNNPAGLLYKLTIDGANCEETTPDGDGGGDGDGDVEGASLTIVKTTEGGDGTFTFNVDQAEPPQNSSVTDVVAESVVITTGDEDNTETIELPPGIYDVTEDLQEGWTLITEGEDAPECVYENEGPSAQSVENGTTVVLYDGDEVTCYFTNVKDVESITEEEDDDSPSAHSNPPGSVLGASTDDGMVLGNTCPLITAYMREGLANDPTQVTALQTFLNQEMSSGLTVNGVFGSLTTTAVNSFQVKYASEVLEPWVPFGLSDGVTPTGFVYKTTLWKINDIACPDLDVPFPTLP